MRARRHNKGRERVSARNPKHLTQPAREHRLCRTATAPRTNGRAMCLGMGRGVEVGRFGTEGGQPKIIIFLAILHILDARGHNSTKAT